MDFLDSYTFAYFAMIALALLVSSLGFKKYVYFISLGYGFSIAALGAYMLFEFRGVTDLVTTLLCLLFIVYGCRLGGFLLYREMKSASYNRTMAKETKSDDQVSLGAKFAIWISVALLYTFQVSPVFFRLQNREAMIVVKTLSQKGGTPLESRSDLVCLIGLIIMACGILLEMSADLQKSHAKKKNPGRFVDTGLYRIVRCPNYLGEILNWTGVFVSGWTALRGPWQWAAAIIGWAGIVYIMFGGARRLELRQNRNYGEDPEYQAYVKKVPILLPLAPLYSVAKYKWLVG
ncbi:MAG: DUF1295 domain-containing protein [Lachnospiraceae bacterium]|nr:DUF1295 domain-containing protein [Lachnospiraceae bacterium]